MSFGVEGFNSFEEMRQAMAERERVANESILDEQRTIEWGSCWCQPLPDEGIFVFGQVLTRVEATENEGPDEVTGLLDSYERNYRFSKCYSILEMEGEYGSKHLAAIWPLPLEDFERARDNGWNAWPELIMRVAEETAAARERVGWE